MVEEEEEEAVVEEEVVGLVQGREQGQVGWK